MKRNLWKKNNGPTNRHHENLSTSLTKTRQRNIRLACV